MPSQFINLCDCVFITISFFNQKIGKEYQKKKPPSNSLSEGDSKCANTLSIV